MFGLGSGWPVDGAECPAGLAPFVAGPLHIILTAPTANGLNYPYRLTWNRSVTPASANDAALRRDEPDDQLRARRRDEHAAGPAPAGRLDRRRLTRPAAPRPPTRPPPRTPRTPSRRRRRAARPSERCCRSAPTRSACSVTDGGSLTTTGSFSITVVDTTAPTLAGMPGDVNLTTAGPTAVLTYASPSATDVVDASPTVAACPRRGRPSPSATRRSPARPETRAGTARRASFTAHVTHSDAAAARGAGVLGVADRGSEPLVVNGARTVPVKVS